MKQLYGYWDQSTGKYWVVGTDGQPRPASQAEASAIYGYGGSYTWNVGDAENGYYDESDKQYYVIDANGQRRLADSNEAARVQQGGGNVDLRPQVPAPTPAPAAAPAAPDPYADWQSSDPNTRTYRWFDETAREFYESNPTNAWGQYISAEFGDRATPFRDYAQGQYQRYYNEYLKNSEANAGAQINFTDSLTGTNAAAIRQSFAMETPSVKGYRNVWMPAGRQT